MKFIGGLINYWEVMIIMLLDFGECKSYMLLNFFIICYLRLVIR